MGATKSSSITPLNKKTSTDVKVKDFAWYLQKQLIMEWLKWIYLGFVLQVQWFVARGFYVLFTVNSAAKQLF